MDRDHRTRRNFMFTALSAMGGALGVAACQKTTTQFEGSSLDRPSTPDDATGQTQAVQSVSENASAQKTAQALDGSAPMPGRSLGNTNLVMPVLGLGGSASPLSRSRQESEAIAIIERALELGVRYFDTAANYGPSEEFLGQVLPPYRSEVAIATKTSRRTYDEAWRELERSLQRLNTDTIDLWQFHSLAYDWDLDTILEPRTGAIRAAQEAQEQGIVRYVGVTGHHSPEIIVKALQRYPFDAALVPINAADKHTPIPFITTLLPVAQQQNTAIIAMKVPAYGRLFEPGVLSGMPEAMGYALSQPGVHLCIIAAETVEQLEENVAAAQAFQPMTNETLVAIEQRTAPVWQENSFFRQWT